MFTYVHQFYFWWGQCCSSFNFFERVNDCCLTPKIRLAMLKLDINYGLHELFLNLWCIYLHTGIWIVILCRLIGFHVLFRLRYDNIQRFAYNNYAIHRGHSWCGVPRRNKVDKVKSFGSSTFCHNLDKIGGKHYKIWRSEWLLLNAKK